LNFGAFATVERLLKVGVWVWPTSCWASHLLDHWRVTFNYFYSKS